jgi:GH18 family chitinase
MALTWIGNLHVNPPATSLILKLYREYPTTADRSGSPDDLVNYVSFLQNFKTFLAGKGSYGLSITLPSSYWYMQGFDITDMADSIDFVRYFTVFSSLG